MTAVCRAPLRGTAIAKDFAVLSSNVATDDEKAASLKFLGHSYAYRRGAGHAISVLLGGPGPPTTGSAASAEGLQIGRAGGRAAALADGG